MSGSKVRDMIKAGARVIDVRSPAVIADEAYPGGEAAQASRLCERGERGRPRRYAEVSADAEA